MKGRWSENGSGFYRTTPIMTLNIDWTFFFFLNGEGGGWVETFRIVVFIVVL